MWAQQVDGRWALGWLRLQGPQQAAGMQQRVPLGLGRLAQRRLGLVELAQAPVLGVPV